NCRRIVQLGRLEAARGEFGDAMRLFSVPSGIQHEHESRCADDPGAHDVAADELASAWPSTSHHLEAQCWLSHGLVVLTQLYQPHPERRTRMRGRRGLTEASGC